jgi:hypothetical protein
VRNANKAVNFAPAAPDAAKLRRLLRIYASRPKNSIFYTLNQESICLFGEAVCAVK